MKKGTEEIKKERDRARDEKVGTLVVARCFETKGKGIKDPLKWGLGEAFVGEERGGTWGPHLITGRLPVTVTGMIRQIQLV